MTYTYNPDDKFGAKDTLAEDHPEKKILGVEFDEEFLKISTAISTINIDIADLIYNSGFPEPPESTVDDPVVYGRAYYDPDPDDDDTRKSGSWIETATKEEVDQISQDIIDINVDIGDIQGGGAFPEAPEDGNQYARQDAGWSMVVTYDGSTVEDNLAAEIQARIDGDAALQASIDAIPPAPVDSVNGKTGAVVLDAADVGALPDTYDPGINYPVTSVNGKTGAVVLSAADVGASTYDGSDAVKITGAQTIAGIKTFDEDIRGKKNVIAYYSDIRLKDVQGPIENPVEKVKAIETFYYTHGDRARELGYEGSEVQVGVSAQSVQAVAPELIHRAPVDDDGEGGSVTGESYITVDYPRLVPLLIESIKQLSAEIEELKK